MKNLSTQLNPSAAALTCASVSSPSFGNHYAVRYLGVLRFYYCAYRYFRTR